MAAANSALEKLFQRARQAIAERDWDRAKQNYLQALGIRSNMITRGAIRSPMRGTQ